jgi:NAD(P)H-dependent FMN reductase
MYIDIFDIAPIPPYNEDVRQLGFPAPVEDRRARIKAADGLLLVTPEYNYSIPGVLKNAIDWASRPPEQLSTASRSASRVPRRALTAPPVPSIICASASSFSMAW